MSRHPHSSTCQKCGGTLFREEKLVELDSTVAIEDKLPIPAQTMKVVYRYICIGCNEIVDQKK